MDSITPVDIFAGGYYLESGYFGDPWNTVCDRSPDGLAVAFASPLNVPKRSFVHWFRLDDPPGNISDLL